LEWEALQFVDGPVIDEERRAKAISGAAARIRARQRSGHLTNEFSARELLLAMVALTWFPVAFPQLTRLITRRSVSDAVFKTGQKAFLRKFGAAFEAKRIRARASQRTGENRHKRFP
jgi:hypothetical protein